MSNSNKEIHSKSPYSDPSPYPEVQVLSRNPDYAEILMDDYAGIISEFTAINQYLYHHFICTPINKELGDLLKNIARSEMLHLEILGSTIISLGGNPVISGSGSLLHNNFWSGKSVYYGTNLCGQLKADIEAEYQAIAEYQRHILCIGDSQVKTILQRIILDEKVHIRLLSQALEKFCGCKVRCL